MTREISQTHHPIRMHLKFWTHDQRNLQHVTFITFKQKWFPSQLSDCISTSGAILALCSILKADSSYSSMLKAKLPEHYPLFYMDLLDWTIHHRSMVMITWSVFWLTPICIICNKAFPFSLIPWFACSNGWTSQGPKWYIFTIWIPSTYLVKLELIVERQ